MLFRSRIMVRLYLFFVLFLLGVSSVSAHFKLNLNVRILHVEHLSDGLRVFMRLPMPYLVANLLCESDESGLPEPAPYTRNRLEEGRLVHYVDIKQLKESTAALALLAAQGLDLSIGGDSVIAQVEGFRIYQNGAQPDFATLDEARSAFQSDPVFKLFEQDVYVGDTTIDVMMKFNSPATVYAYALSSKLDPGLPDQDQTANLVLDYSPAGIKVFRVRGLLHEPVVVTRSIFDAVLTFIKEGVKHILEGLDHVLFVICLVLGAMRLTPLLWRVTGFTIGHSITLSIGFFGYVPKAAWFVPAVETGIALSIIYVAIVAVAPDLRRVGRHEKSERAVVAVTALIGLLHGLGFSFVLQNILQVTSPNIWQSLVAFNIGVEIGQVLIVMVAWILFYLVGRVGGKAAKVNRYLIACFCIVTASYWVVARGTLLLGNL